MESLRQELSRSEGSALKLEARVGDGESRIGEAETQLAMAREKLAWAEAQSGQALAQKEQEWESRMDSATSGAHQEVRATMEAFLLRDRRRARAGGTRRGHVLVYVELYCFAVLFALLYLCLCYLSVCVVLLLYVSLSSVL